MTEQQTPSPRSRMQALLAIPDNQRTEEQWDELHELEITLAPGNRIGHQEKQGPPPGQGRAGGGGRGGAMGSPRGGPRSGPAKGQPKGESRSGGRGGQPPRPVSTEPQSVVDAAVVPEEGGDEAPAGSPAKKPFRRFHKKPPKPAEA